MLYNPIFIFLLRGTSSPRTPLRRRSRGPCAPLRSGGSLVISRSLRPRIEQLSMVSAAFARESDIVPAPMSERFLAIDLGAESGRAMLGELTAGRLSLSEVRRFPNEPIRDASGLHWNAPKLWSEIQAGLEAAANGPLDGIGLDTWGCDFGLLGEDNTLLE